MNSFLFLLSEWAMTVRPYAAALAQVMMTASVLMLVSLTWERHFAICYPHQYRIRIRTIPLWRHLARYIVPVVVLSFVLNIPTFINTYKVCTNNQEIPTKTVHHSVKSGRIPLGNIMLEMLPWVKIFPERKSKKLLDYNLSDKLRANFKVRYFLHCVVALRNFQYT